MAGLVSDIEPQFVCRSKTLVKHIPPSQATETKSMGRPFVEFLHTARGDKVDKFCCINCGCDVASEQALVWEGFMNVATPALLFRAAVNLEESLEARQERLSTGNYMLTDISCRGCTLLVGWRYLWAEREDQKYKQGGFLVSQEALVRVGGKATALAEPAPAPAAALGGAS